MKKFVILAAIAALAVLGTATSALAASSPSGSTTITAGVNSKIVVTAPADKAWGWLDPDSGDNQYVQNLKVRSNCSFTLDETTTANSFPGAVFYVDGASLSGTFASAPTTAGALFSRTFHVNLNDSATWLAATAADDTYSATVLYTAVVAP